MEKVNEFLDKVADGIGAIIYYALALAFFGLLIWLTGGPDRGCYYENGVEHCWQDPRS